VKTSTLVLSATHYILLVGGVLALAYVAFIIADARTYQSMQESKFENESQKEGQNLAPDKTPHPVIEGGAIGEMEVPRLGMKDIFVQGDSSRILRRAVGHISNTALPGEQGNVVLTGHRDTFFRPLRHIQQGDAITLKTLSGDFLYRVESTAIVAPSDVQVLRASNERTLTLITCFPFYYIGGAPKRFIVRARQVEVSTQ
jgi:sortase A